MSEFMLPGLERLMDTCRQGPFSLKVFPPARVPQAAGTLIGEQPLDPMLAAVYRQLGGLSIADFLDVFRFDEHFNSLARMNEVMRGDGQEPFRSSVLFGKEPALACYYATLPTLADPAGVQPVIHIDANEDSILVLPVASSVDGFFDVFSRYLELVASDEAYVEEGRIRLSLPLSVPELVARDEPLVEAMRAGRFDPWMTRTEETEKWLRRVGVSRQ